MSKKISILALVAMGLLFSLINASATVSPYGWWRQGEKNTLITSFMEDSGPLNNPMYDNFNNSAFYLANVAMFTNCAAGGPLGPNKIFSTLSAKQHYAPNNNGGYYSMSITNVPGVGWAPATSWNIKTNRNWVMECWFLPVGNGTAKGDRDQACILEMGGNNFASSAVPACTNWGPQFWLVASNEVLHPGGGATRQDGTVELQCFMMGPDSSIPNPNTIGINASYPSGIPYYKDTNGLSWSFQLGTNVIIQTPNRKKWVHMAVVRDDTAPLPPQCPPFYPGEVGTVTLYVDGVACGVTNSHRCYQPGIMQAPYNVEQVETTDRPSIGTDNASTRNIGNNPIDLTTGIIDNGNTNSAWPLDFGAPGYAFPISSGGIGGAGNRQCNAFIDEVRFSTFANGAFSLSDLLLRSVPGPGIVQQPVDTVAYSGQPAVLQVVAAYDDANTYQWWKVSGTTLGSITGTVATNQILVLPSASYASGDKFVCQLSNPDGTVFTTTNTVTTTPNPTANVTAYQSAVQAESSLISYYPADGDSATGTALTDIKGGNNGTLSGKAIFDGSTSRFAGCQGITFNRSGGFQNVTNVDSLGDDVSLGVNSAFDLASSNGTIEAVLYMDPAAARMPVAMNFPHMLYGFSWLSSANLHLGTGNAGTPVNNGANARCVFSADAGGHLYYWASYFDVANAANSAPLLWTVPGGTIGKTLHVAFTFNGGSNITCYVNGQNLGTQFPYAPTNNVFGIGSGYPWHIGNATMTPFRVDPNANGPPGVSILSEGIIPAVWYGSVDELAIYAAPLSEATIVDHAYKYRNGTTANPATVTMLTPSKSMYANSSQTFSVTAGGKPPYTYTWKTNGVVDTDSTGASLTVNNIRSTVSVTCTVQGDSGSPAVSSPCVVTITTPTPGSYADQVMTTAPMAFYRFNEATGSVLYDWAGTHDGIYTGTGSFQKNVAGPAAGEGGLQMFGTNAASQFTAARVPFAPELMAQGPGNTNGAFTYEVWFKPTVCNGYLQSPVSAWYRRGNNRAGNNILYDAGNQLNNGARGVFYGRSGRYNNINQNNTYGANTAAFSSTNVWHHVVYEFAPNGTSSGNGTTGFQLNGTMTLWVDGLVDGYDANYSMKPYTVNAGHWQPNHYGDFIVGNTADDNPSIVYQPVNGVIGDVAVYNYALSTNQVQNHYQAYYTVAGITNNPVGVATNESYLTSITLSAGVFGNGNTYQWFVTNAACPSGCALDGTKLNPDGSLHYPPVFNGVFDTVGVDAPVLTITQVTPADAGIYGLVVYNQLNPGGQTNSAGATVIVTPDTTVPKVDYVVAVNQVIYNSTASPGAVQIRFSKRVDVTTATTAGNYSISGGVGQPISVYMAQNTADTLFGGDTRTVTLQTTALTPGQTYTVTLNGGSPATPIIDQAATPNALVPVTISFKAPVAGPGLVWDYFTKVSGSYGSAMGNLTDGQYNGSPVEFGLPPTFNQTTKGFPFCPQFETTLQAFDTLPLNLSASYNPGSTGLGANPVFGTGIGTGAGVNYGVLISGWITPTRTDDYTFFLENDDDAVLYLSTDASPNNLNMIAQGLGVNTVFTELVNVSVGNPHVTSTPQHLVAGVPYFVELLLSQGSGNDFARVAWRSATGTDSGTPAANLSPIPSAVLSSWSAAKPVLTQTYSAGVVTLSWTGGGVLLQSTNVNAPLSQWTPVSGNPYPASPYSTSASGTQMYYRAAH